jgi:hypothetical protein
MESVSLYSEARTEYLKQLSNWISGPLVEFFRKEYSQCVARAGRRSMAEFQDFCSKVPLWNQDVIDSHVGSILDNCRCDYIEELMTAVFIAHTKMLTAIRVNAKQQKLQITLPKLDHFLHRVFTECARAFWKAPFLFSEDNSPVERQKNLLQAEAMCVDAISSAVRSLLPIKNILRDYLESDDAEEAEEQEVQESQDVQEVQEESHKETTHNIAPPSTPVAPVAPTPSEPVVEASTPAPTPLEPAVIPSAPAEAAETAVVTAVTAESSPLEQTVETAVVPVVPIAVIPPSEPETAPDQKKPVLVLEKLESEPIINTPPPSNHTVSGVVAETSNNIIEKIDIPTERSVHFNPYDTVFRTDSENPEIRYVDKENTEEQFGWDEVPRLTIDKNASSLDLNEITELDPPPDIDAPLNGTGDFEVLA